MSGQDDHNSFRSWRQRRAERARQRDREQADAELIRDLRWRFESCCARTPLGRMIFTASGVSTSVPRVGHIDLGPPVSLFVKAGLGQTADDFIAAAPSIAAALSVAGLTVTPHAGNWVRIVLMTNPPGVTHFAG